MAITIIDDYSDQLLRIIRRNHNNLSVDTIESFRNHYKAQRIEHTPSFFHRQNKMCLQRSQLEIIDHNRHAMFRRMITVRIEHLLPRDPTQSEQLLKAGKVLSRRVLLGLFHALEDMAGEEVFQHGHDICLSAIRYLKHADNTFEWHDLYEHKIASTSVDNVLMEAALFFHNPAKQILIFQDAINADRPPCAAYPTEGKASRNWHLDERGAILLLRGLYKGLKAQLKSAEHSAALVQRHGPDQCAHAHALIKQLDIADV
ncbi:MAG: hypothetical protein JKY27_03200 [Magnetovibrio sp.]|nr:hypothetical protein [Magnetovibrio sp.]